MRVLTAKTKKNHAKGGVYSFISCLYGNMKAGGGADIKKMRVFFVVRSTCTIFVG
jgi:hypothetical protein